MTKSPPDSRRCTWCGTAFQAPPGRGRPQLYCRPSHRQRSYEARRLAEQRGLGDDEVLIDRASFTRLRDTIYRIEAALEDVDGDLSGTPTAASYRQAALHLYDAASGVRNLVFEPKARLG